jgi:hypothetical protein
METFGNKIKQKSPKIQQSDQVKTIQFCTNCNKQFINRSGLWKHKQKCNFLHEDNKTSPMEITPELIIKVLEQNKELTNIISQQNKTINELSKNNNNTIINNNSNNNTFNLQLFLNETCKDAINIEDFIKSIQLSLEDLEFTGRNGYAEGISNIIIKNLTKLEEYERPLHCSDVKREILYIKCNNTWNKETDDKPLLTNAIKTIANENIKQINKWKQQYPDCTNSDSKKNNLYLKIVSNSMCGLNQHETNKNINKIASNISKEVVINKNY